MWINKERFRGATQPKPNDALLTTLIILLSTLEFVGVPLQASGIVAARYFASGLAQGSFQQT
jgi:hypothetical protein